MSRNNRARWFRVTVAEYEDDGHKRVGGPASVIVMFDLDGMLERGPVDPTGEIRQAAEMAFHELLGVGDEHG